MYGTSINFYNEEMDYAALLSYIIKIKLIDKPNKCRIGGKEREYDSNWIIENFSEKVGLSISNGDEELSLNYYSSSNLCELLIFSKLLINVERLQYFFGFHRI